MNKSAKGKRKENLCAEELKKEGWEIVFKSIRTRFQRVDFAGRYDIVGRKILSWVENGRAFQSAQWIFVAVTHAGAKNMEEEYAKIKGDMKFALSGMKFQSWVWHERGWHGRGENRKFEEGRWEKIDVV